MDITAGINFLHLEYIRPLFKWRIIDVKNLLSEVPYAHEYSSFCRVLRRLEERKIVKSFLDPWTAKKYISLSSFGESVVSSSRKGQSVDEQSWYHDAKASELAKGLLEYHGKFDDVELPHRMPLNLPHYPDAVLHGRGKKGKKIKVAFELEFTQKSRERILSKVNYYLRQSDYDLIIYFFGFDRMHDSYKKMIEEAFGEKAFGRIMMMQNGTIQTRKVDLEKTKIFFDQKEWQMDQIFSD